MRRHQRSAYARLEGGWTPWRALRTWAARCRRKRSGPCLGVSSLRRGHRRFVWELRGNTGAKEYFELVELTMTQEEIPIHFTHVTLLSRQLEELGRTAPAALAGKSIQFSNMKAYVLERWALERAERVDVRWVVKIPVVFPQGGAQGGDDEGPILPTAPLLRARNKQ